MLHEMLSRISREYAYERAKPFANNEFGNFVRRDVSLEARKRLIFLPFDLKTKASVGAGNWAAVPWLGFFDPVITESATHGFYVVYLINPQSEKFFLSLNQGTTALYREYGEPRGREILRRRAIDMRERVPEYAKDFSSDPIELGSLESLPQGYEAGHSFGREFHPDRISEPSFYEDLERMLYAYEALIDRGGLLQPDQMHEESGTSDVVETRRYILSRRIERAPNVRKKVLEHRGIACEACGLRPDVHLGYEGPSKNAPVDVHHLTPLMGLAEGESRRYKIPDDFRVLCPTCHRMIHKLPDANDIDALKAKLTFNHSR